jgi:uncharacterized protein YkuJ
MVKIIYYREQSHFQLRILSEGEEYGFPEFYVKSIDNKIKQLLK